jgi:hypothetical protein
VATSETRLRLTYENDYIRFEDCQELNESFGLKSRLGSALGGLEIVLAFARPGLEGCGGILAGDHP